MAKRNYDKHLGFTVDSETHHKLHYVAKYEGRSASAHILYLIRQDILAFEQQHGKIEYPPKAEE